MYDNVVFIGGIHGVGKSTICRELCRELDMQYLSASDLLRWGEISEDSKNKKVENIPYTQNRLIEGLRNIIQNDKFYLLDGHYCLLNKNNEIENISLDTFVQINPIAIGLIWGDISEIKNRLEMRDNKPYEFKILELLQNSEMLYSEALSETLNIPLYISENKDYSNMLYSLCKMIGTG